MEKSNSDPAKSKWWGGEGSELQYSVENTQNRIHQESGRTAFIISSWSLLKGGYVVFENHPPTRFNMDEVYALYIFRFNVH